MDFFGRQDRARRQTRWLVLVFAFAVLAVAGLVSVVVTLLIQALDGRWAAPDRHWFEASAGLLGIIALATVGFILLASLFRHLRLRAGGGSVAVALGGEPVLPEDRDPGRRRLQNVIEEMAVASGIPAPQAYVLEHERSINAFAAGHSPADAAVAVTRGALDGLSRAELQGVVAHEFSHVLNGDMRLNIRLMGYLFGILAVSTIGRLMLRGGGHRGIRLGRGRGGGVFALAGAAIFVLGYAGVFCGRLIQAAVSRQREFLADAAAVQFTRQTEGLAGALRKIAGLPAHSWLGAPRAEEVSHMLFANGRRGFARWFATHPPIEARLAALGAPAAGSVEEPAHAAAAMGASGLAPAAVGGGSAAGVTTAAVADSVGRTGRDPAGYTAALRARVPAAAWESVHSSDLAVSALFALLLDRGENVRQHQLGALGARLGQAVARHSAELAEALSDTNAADRLALADLAFPVLRRLPEVRRHYLTETIELLATVDGDLDLFEAMLAGRVTACLSALDREHVPRPASEHARATSATRLLAALALRSHADRASAEAAFRAGLERLADDWPVARSTPLPTRAPAVAELRRDLATLADPSPDAARHCVEALAAAAAEDGQISATEYAILRAVCGALALPLPPVTRDQNRSTGMRR